MIYLLHFFLALFQSCHVVFKWLPPNNGILSGKGSGIGPTLSLDSKLLFICFFGSLDSVWL
jgi:hypothetical protein